MDSLTHRTVELRPLTAVLARYFGCLPGFPLILSAVVLFGALRANAAQGQQAPESGVFFVFAAGKKIGTERYRITPTAAGLEVTGEIELEIPGSPPTEETCTLLLSPELQPASYERQQKSPKKGGLTAQFGPTEVTLASTTGSGNYDQIFYLSRDRLVVLDTNFFHHYEFLLRQYDLTSPGPQQFSVLVPQEALPAVITLELAGKENQAVGEGTLALNRFQAATEDVKIEIWATPSGEIHRISIPASGLEILRQAAEKVSP